MIRVLSVMTKPFISETLKQVLIGGIENEYVVLFWGFHGGNYEQCRLLGCYIVRLL
jgi:hypothetical protein